MNKYTGHFAVARRGGPPPAGEPLPDGGATTGEPHQYRGLQTVRLAHDMAIGGGWRSPPGCRSGRCITRSRTLRLRAV